MYTEFSDYPLVRAAAKAGAVDDFEILLVGGLLAQEEEQEWQPALQLYALSETSVFATANPKLRDWMRDRASAIRNHLNAPR